MAFGGNFGAAAGVVDQSVLFHPRGNVVYAADGLSARVESPSGHLLEGGEEGQIRTLLIQDSTTNLAAQSDSTEDGSAGDTGVLTTAPPGANEHGLPINFGPGQGSWFQTALARLSCTIVGDGQAPSTSGTLGWLIPLQCQILFGDLVIIVKNLHVSALRADIRLHYDHSQEI